MTLEELRRSLDESWARLDNDSREKKDSHGTALALMKLYRRLDPDAKALADVVFSEWLRAQHQRKRFDALVLVDEFKIPAALPTLRAMQVEAERRNDNEAPYDWTMINRIIARLVEKAE